MHPREGWPKDGSRPPLFSRRNFLAGAGAGLAAVGGGALLDACAPALAGSGTVPLPRPENPVRWPLYSENKAIASGLQPETGATLQIYNWVAYVNQACLNHFAKKYNCKVQVTTFNTMNEALSKLRSGLSFDVFMGVTVDVLGQLIESKLVQPLNHSYIPNISQAWPDFTNPFYDQGWQYTSPYTIYTTGIGYRRDLIPDAQIRGMSNPYEIFWDSKFNGKIGIYDDYREAISMALMKNGITDLNTGNQKYINQAQKTLISLINAVNVRTSINGVYIGIPKGTFDIHQSWSGDIVAAWQYTPVQNMKTWQTLGYWFPANRKGAVFNDTITIPANAQNPVLAHHFLDWMMTYQNAMLNFTWNGYQPPQRQADPATLTTTKSYYGEPYVFPWLSDAVVHESDFHTGHFQEELTPQVDQLWHNAWQAFNSA